MATTADLSRGAFIKFNGELMQVLEYEHRTPGNLRAFYQVKMRNVRSGKLAENRFRAGEAIEFVRVETRDYQYLYLDGDSMVCMDNSTYEQVYVDKILVGEAFKFIKEGINLLIAFDEDNNAISATLPPSIVVEITYSEPGIKGDTATNTLKPATIDTGAEVRVPLFVNTGEKIRIDTVTGEYIERVK
ncbi:MAG: elongation factor P [Cytophagales bacterium]|nr:MAG: elongation factor P [Cytophagales bacterium]